MEVYYNLYYNNEEKIKKYLKYAGYGGLAFFSGFVLFYLFNRKKVPKAIEKDIPQMKEMKVEEVRKFLRKLINYVLLNLSQSFDRLGIKRLEQFQDILSDNLEQSLSSFIGNNIEIESEKVDEPKKEENSTVIIPQEFFPVGHQKTKEEAKEVSLEDSIFIL
jgi:DNA replication protein DnaD